MADNHSEICHRPVYANQERNQTLGQNLTTCVHSSLSLFQLPEASFSVLPINHTYEFNIHVMGSICGGAALCFNDSIKHVKENLSLFKPHMSLMVPMIVEGLYKNIWKETEKAGLTAHLKYGIWFSNLMNIDQIIEGVGLTDRKNNFPAQLSGASSSVSPSPGLLPRIPN